jgi:hypothetical protein
MRLGSRYGYLILAQSIRDQSSCARRDHGRYGSGQIYDGRTIEQDCLPRQHVSPRWRIANSNFSRSGSARRIGAWIDGLLISSFAVQFQKVDQQQPVRWFSVIFDLGKLGPLLGQCQPRS